MKRARLQAATVGGSSDEVAQAFYEALHNADIQQLMACWAEEDEIVCVQPDGLRLIGPGSIRRGFEALFAAGGVQVQLQQTHKIVALACEVHHLLERLEMITPQGARTVWVNTTNVYHKTPLGWRMVARHASPGAAQVPHNTAVGQMPVLH